LLYNGVDARADLRETRHQRYAMTLYYQIVALIMLPLLSGRKLKTWAAGAQRPPTLR
jgi:hypothetical protein